MCIHTPCYSTSVSWQAPIWRESPYAQETVSCPRVSFSPSVVLVSGGVKVIILRVPGGQEWPIKCWACCCKKKGGSIIDPWQINKPAGQGAWYAQQSKEFVISTLSCWGWQAFQKEHSYSGPTWKTGRTLLQYKLRLHPQTHLSTIPHEAFASAVRSKAICYNAVIFFILLPIRVHNLGSPRFVSWRSMTEKLFLLLFYRQRDKNSVYRRAGEKEMEEWS